MERLNNEHEKMKVEAVEPSERYKQSYIQALREYAEIDGDDIIDIEDRERNFDKFLTHLENDKSAQEDGRVPSFQTWYVQGDKYIGRVNYRPTLNDKLHFKGGNIGYSVRPSERRKGYATMFLQHSIERAKKDGLTELLLTCDVNNVGSNKTIQNCGGILTSEDTDEDGVKFNRYTIKL